jgi:hypothetical protein
MKRENVSQIQPDDHESPWQKTSYSNLIRYAPSGKYFARIRVGGKLIRQSLKTNVLSVAKLRLSAISTCTSLPRPMMYSPIALSTTSLSKVAAVVGIVAVADAPDIHARAQPDVFKRRQRFDFALVVNYFWFFRHRNFVAGR